MLLYTPLLTGSPVFPIIVSFGEDYIAWILFSLRSPVNYITPLRVSYSLSPKPNYRLPQIICSYLSIILQASLSTNLSRQSKYAAIIVFILGAVRTLPSIIIRILNAMFNPLI